MESRAFIREAKALIEDIKTHAAASEADQAQAVDAIQTRVNSLFSGLQNPSLPSALDLRDVAVAAGLKVAASVQHKLDETTKWFE